ncbi:MAG: hypothetical protein RRY12_07265 [Cloacibacillus sp.]
MQENRTPCGASLNRMTSELTEARRSVGLLMDKFDVHDDHDTAWVECCRLRDIVIRLTADVESFKKSLS